MRAFAFGLIVGTAVCFAVLRLIDSPPAQNAEKQQMSARPTSPPAPAPACPEITKLSAAPAPSSAERNIQPKAPIEAPASATTPVDQARIALQAISDQDASQVCGDASSRREQRAKAKRDAEPKDAGWAYPTEQLVLYHVESQMSSDRYKTLHIDCRTTYCEMRMEGVGEESRELANKLAQEIARQPWSEMVYKGGGGSSIGDEWSIRHDWFRPRTEAERRLYPLQRN